VELHNLTIMSGCMNDWSPRSCKRSVTMKWLEKYCKNKATRIIATTSTTSRLLRNLFMVAHKSLINL
jgi:hypothetical protein